MWGVWEDHGYVGCMGGSWVGGVHGRIIGM